MLVCVQAGGIVHGAAPHAWAVYAAPSVQGMQGEGTNNNSVAGSALPSASLQAGLAPGDDFTWCGRCGSTLLLFNARTSTDAQPSMHMCPHCLHCIAGLASTWMVWLLALVHTWLCKLLC